jgi:hypothetical protein
MNSWETEVPGYSVDKFYTHAKDSQGHSVQINTKFPDYVAAAIAELVQSKEIPEYATAQDFIRDSVFHRLYWCSKHRSRKISRLLPIMISIQESENQIKEVEKLNEMVEKIRKGCEALYSIQDLATLRDFIDRQRDNIEGIREPYWGKASRILDEYEQRLKAKEEGK